MFNIVRNFTLVRELYCRIGLVDFTIWFRIQFVKWNLVLQSYIFKGLNLFRAKILYIDILFKKHEILFSTYSKKTFQKRHLVKLSPFLCITWPYLIKCEVNEKKGYISNCLMLKDLTLSLIGICSRTLCLTLTSDILWHP